MNKENENNSATSKEIVIRRTTREAFNFVLQYKLNNGYSFVKTLKDEEGIQFCALLVRKNDMIFKIFGV
jgi:hypothetical protein